MNKKVSIATLSAFLVATSPAMAVNDSKVSVRVKNEHIENVLKKVFNNTDISYRIVDNRIFLQDNTKTVFNRPREQSEVRLSIIPAFQLSGRMSL